MVLDFPLVCFFLGLLDDSERGCMVPLLDSMIVFHVVAAVSCSGVVASCFVVDFVFAIFSVASVAMMKVQRSSTFLMGPEWLWLGFGLALAGDAVLS